MISFNKNNDNSGMRYAKTPSDKIALVDAANHERLRTLV